MRTFKEMIDAGIAQRKYTDFVPATPETDPIVRTYNNCFGLFTDTHMSKMHEGDYVITGSLCRDPGRFNSFLYSTNFGLGTQFRTNYKTSSITSLSSWLCNNGLCGHYEMLNNDPVYRVCATPVGINHQCDYSACCVGCDSDMPVAQLGEKTLEVLGNMVEQSETSADLTKQVNESDYITGSDWYCTGSADGLCLVSESLGKAILMKEISEASMSFRN